MLTATAVARQLGISARAVYALAATGALPAYRFGRTLRDCLSVAFTAFAHDDDGPVWAPTLIAKTRRVLKATETDK